jgi:hypothetical protein
LYLFFLSFALCPLRLISKFFSRHGEVEEERGTK